MRCKVQTNQVSIFELSKSHQFHLKEHHFPQQVTPFLTVKIDLSSEAISEIMFLNKNYHLL